MQYNSTFDFCRGLDLFFLRVSQFCSSGIRVTSVLEAGSVLKACLSQVWSCCLMKFTTRFSPRQSRRARSRRAASFGSCRGDSWGSSWLPLASSGVSGTQEMLCKCSVNQVAVLEVFYVTTTVGESCSRSFFALKPGNIAVSMQESRSLNCIWLLSSALYILYQQIVPVL